MKLKYYKLASMLVCLSTACLGFIVPAVGCASWNHQWVIVQNVLSHSPSDSLIFVWKAWYVATYSKEPPSIEIYPGGENFVLDSPLPTPSNSRRILLYAPSYEETNSWKVDKSLFPDAVVRWEQTVSAVVCWSELDAAGKVVNIGEIPLLFGWNQTMVLGTCMVPIVQFGIITSASQTKTLFSLLEAILPPLENSDSNIVAP